MVDHGRGGGHGEADEGGEGKWLRKRGSGEVAKGVGGLTGRPGNLVSRVRTRSTSDELQMRVRLKQAGAFLGMNGAQAARVQGGGSAAGAGRVQLSEKVCRAGRRSRRRGKHASRPGLEKKSSAWSNVRGRAGSAEGWGRARLRTRVCTDCTSRMVREWSHFAPYESRQAVGEVVVDEEASAERAALVGSRYKARAVVCVLVSVSAVSVSPAKAVEQHFERVQGSTPPKVMKSSVASSSRSHSRNQDDRPP